MIFELGGAKLGRIVLYKHDKGWIPAIVETIYPMPDTAKEDAKPNLALVIFVTGFHGACFPKSLCEHGTKVGEWHTIEEVKADLKKIEDAKVAAEKSRLETTEKVEAEAARVKAEAEAKLKEAEEAAVAEQKEKLKKPAK
jgi:hypothetical protein